MNANGGVYLAAFDDPVPTEVRVGGLGCLCCALPMGELRIGLSSNYLGWNYPDPDASRLAPGWDSVRYDIAECG